MTLKPEDFIGAPCDCLPCRAAKVDHLDIRRDPHTGKWLHGPALKGWYEARDAARKRFQEAGKGLAWPATTGACAPRRRA